MTVRVGINRKNRPSIIDDGFFYRSLIEDFSHKDGWNDGAATRVKERRERKKKVILDDVFFARCQKSQEMF